MVSKIAFVGCGAMGSAILSGVLAAKLLTKDKIIVCERNFKLATLLKKQHDIQIVDTIAAVVAAEILILAVKPGDIATVLAELKALDFKGLVISVAAATEITTLEKFLPEKTPVIRVMPNTPVAVGAGMTAIALGHYADKAMGEKVEKIFSTLGRAKIVTEKELEAMSALSGAGPGYAFVILDALADAGVRIGLKREIAIEAAAQTLYGAAKMLLETGRHPAELRDEVTSPGGTTIAGIHAMEIGGLRGVLIDGVVACMERGEEISRNNREG